MGSEAVPAQQTLALVVRNARSTEMTLIREPYGDEFNLPAGGAFEIRAEGPEGHHLEIDVRSDCIVVVGWSGSVLDVYRDGVNLSGPSPPVPPVPEGMSVRGFLGMILGPPREQG